MRRRKPDPRWIQAWLEANGGGWYRPMGLDAAHPIVAEAWVCHVCGEGFTPEDHAMIQPLSFKHPVARDGWWAHHRECGATLFFDDPKELRSLRPSNYADLTPERQALVDRRLRISE